MKEIEILKLIMETASTNEKINIIRSNKDNELFKKCLLFLLDGNIITGISKKKISKKMKPVHCKKINSLEECMDYLIDHNTGTDQDVWTVQKYLKTLSEEDKEIAEKLLTKTLKLGCSQKIVNTAIPGLIEEWEIQLGSPESELKLRVGEKFYLSQKLNGNRCSWYKGQLKSRQNKIFKGFQHIIDDIHKFGLQDMFIDGELIRKNVDGVSDSENFQIGTGIINSDNESKEEIKLVIFDIFPAEELQTKKSKDSYDLRKCVLLGLKYQLEGANCENLEVVEMLYEGHDTTEIQKWLNYAEEHDWEGIMLNKNTPYECKRTKNLIKIKKFKTADLVILDMEEGSGRLTGTLGSLVVKYKDNVVNVGSGFTDNQRTDFWENKDSYIGKIAEVKYKEETIDKNTKLPSLQFPVFVCIREDKSEESYN